MSVKPSNITEFYAPGYGNVQLVKRSIAYRYFSGEFYNRLTGELERRSFWYWRGQLVHRWSGEGPNPGESWGPFYKGQIIWLNAAIFQKLE